MTVPSGSSHVRHNPQAGRFEIGSGPDLAVLEYLEQGDTLVFIHTEVPPALEGKGLGSQLARAGLEYARAQKKKVVPLCWFVRGYIERHPEYQDLLEIRLG